MIGQTFGVYKILEKRGEGGIGVFYKAHDEVLDEIVGLKTLHRELVSDPKFQRDLQAEAKLQARLRDHPHIVRLNHYLIHEGQHFLVMEYVEGHTLSEKIADWGPYTFSDAAKIVLQVLDALGYAHQNGIVHRDIKPSNIMLADEEVVKVTDFGIAKLVDVSQKTRTAQAKGSLFYMAPEQIQRGQIDGRTDIYALGVTLFEMLTGTVPFTAESEFQIMKKHLEEAPTAPSTFNSAISKAQDELVLHAMEKDPANRFASAEDFANSIRDVVSFAETGSGVAPLKERTVREAKTPGKTRRPEKKARRKKSRAGWVYLAVIILAAAAAYMAFRPSGEPELPPITIKPDTTDIEASTATETEREAPRVVEQTEQAEPAAALTIDIDPFNQRSKVTGTWVDGRRLAGSVPYGAKGLANGLHWVKIETPYGFLTDTVTWTGTDHRMSFFLSESYGRLRVWARFPDGENFADIYVDDRDIGRGTPYEIRELLVGPHKIEVKRDGYRAFGGPRIVRVQPTGKGDVGFEMRRR